MMTQPSFSCSLNSTMFAAMSGPPQANAGVYRIFMIHGKPLCVSRGKGLQTCLFWPDDAEVDTSLKSARVLRLDPRWKR